MQSDNCWHQHSNTYTPGSSVAISGILPGGIYTYIQTQNGWLLERKQDCFDFGYKIYGSHEAIQNRIQTAWESMDSGNLGVLLNGLKGTGKTVSAQLIANWMAGQGIPVLSVSHYIPLSDVLQSISQPCMIIFDEFEKTHAKKEHQQALLTALDGMSRSEHKRLFLFTTNNATIDTNFIDRPSRIRYMWEFDRLGTDVIDELLDDLLASELQHLRTSISTYLELRRVLSIDVVKTVINEVNVFREDPATFEQILNLTDRVPHQFNVFYTDESGKEVMVDPWFAPRKVQRTLLASHLNVTPDKWETFTEDYHGKYSFSDSMSSTTIELHAKLDEENTWMGHLCIPRHKTWLRPLHTLDAYVSNFWVDRKPDDWRGTPKWAQLENDGKLDEVGTDEEKAGYENWTDEHTIFGGNKMLVKIRVEPIYSRTGQTLTQFSQHAH